MSELFFRNSHPSWTDPLVQRPQIRGAEDETQTTILCPKFLPEGTGGGHTCEPELTFISADHRVLNNASLP